MDSGHYGVEKFRGDNHCMRFGESGGNLHLIQVNSSVLNQFDVLEMARDYSAWSVKYHIDLNPMRVAFLVIYLSYYPFLAISSCERK
jgi:hypothetical protein